MVSSYTDVFFPSAFSVVVAVSVSSSSRRPQAAGWRLGKIKVKYMYLCAYPSSSDLCTYISQGAGEQRTRGPGLRQEMSIN